MGGCLVAIHFCHMASLATHAIMGTPSVLFTQTEYRIINTSSNVCLMDIIASFVCW